MVVGIPNPLPIAGIWCEIYKKQGHDSYHFPMMQKYENGPKELVLQLLKVGRP
jgi:hypothetical protein